MKKWTGILVASLVVFGLAGTVLAQDNQSDSDVSVVVGAIDKIDVTDGGTITLDNDDTTPGNDVIGPDTDDGSALLNYTHNSGTDKKITAEVSDNPGGHEITLNVDVNGGVAGYQMICDEGDETGLIPTVYSGIAAGVVTDAAVTYQAQCNASGTPADTYAFTVLFTTADDV